MSCFSPFFQGLLGDGSFLPRIAGATRTSNTSVKFPTTFPTITNIQPKDNNVKVEFSSYRDNVFALEANN